VVFENVLVGYVGYSSTRLTAEIVLCRNGSFAFSVLEVVAPSSNYWDVSVGFKSQESPFDGFYYEYFGTVRGVPWSSILLQATPNTGEFITAHG
jgi:hypothetical protein